MGNFKYSKEEMDINKVLKMNMDMSSSLIESSELTAIRKEADDNIASSLELLRLLGKKEEIIKLNRKVKENNEEIKLDHRPQLDSWEEIVKEAELHNPGPVVLEDFMTVEEIQNAFEELDKINELFSKKTSIINKKDLSFLSIAIALQVAKSLVFPYVAEKFSYGNGFDSDKRLDHNDKAIKKAQKDANDKYRDKYSEKYGKGAWINILYQTVPYDITKGSKALNINMGGKYHRMYTLGHDPILGWLFGTANILTDCITFNTFHTNRISRVDPSTGAKKMVITPEVVLMGQMFRECYDIARVNRMNLPAALFAQAQHLKSDEYTKLGLPVPILSSLNEEFASKLYQENYDVLCFGRDVKIVGASFVVSKLVDIIISLTHGLFRTEDEDRDLYEVRTRKILLISNSIASSSTIINTIINKNLKQLDVGGLLNTISRLCSDIKFISKIKEEFIESEISEKLKKEIDEIDRLYERI